ncbi:hypothetical protein [Singulisphaera sp. PoT]|uniref:hypothetical protein n=1 Tax=Singulisphaera sp. PoT TaxID=3411797 RepID=UPI003BF5F63C
MPKEKLKTLRAGKWQLLTVGILSGSGLVFMWHYFRHDHMADLLARRPGVELMEIDLEVWKSAIGKKTTVKVRDKESLRYIQTCGYGLDKDDNSFYQSALTQLDASFVFEDGCRYSAIVTVSSGRTLLIITYPLTWTTDAIYDQRYLIKLEPSKTKYLLNFFEELGLYKWAN